MTVFIVVYDKESYAISKKLQANIDSYIDENYIGEDNPSSLSDRLNAWDGKTDFLSNVVFDTAIFPTAPAPKAEDDIIELTREYLEIKRYADAWTDEWGTLL